MTTSDIPNGFCNDLLFYNVPICPQCGTLWYVGNTNPEASFQAPFYCGRWCAYRTGDNGLLVLLGLAQAGLLSADDFPGALQIGHCRVNPRPGLRPLFTDPSFDRLPTPAPQELRASLWAWATFESNLAFDRPGQEALLIALIRDRRQRLAVWAGLNRFPPSPRLTGSASGSEDF